MGAVERIDIETGGDRFAALAAGPTGGPVVVCMHGFPDHAESFSPLVERLAAAGYRALAPWMRGYAPSVLTGPYHADQLASDALAIARAAGGGRFALVGHDWGAVAAWQAASRRPPDLACAVTMAVPHPLAFLDHAARAPSQLARSRYMLLLQLPLAGRLAARADFAWLDRLWRTWSPRFELGDVARTRLHACLGASMPAPLRYYRALAWPPREAAARARRLRAAERRPTAAILHLHGAEDGCVEPAAALGQADRVDGPFALEVVPRVGHFLQLEAPDLVGERVLDWLGRHLRA
jgi:pimeloyl-ACP methyl ester carboxylesterase